MNVTSTMRGYGRAAKSRAGSMSHQLKDRSLQKRLDRANDEADRLRFENDLLRDEVEETRSEHRKILDMVEERLPATDEDHSHKGRWLVFLVALGGAGYAVWRRMRSDEQGWERTGTGGSGIRDAAAA